MELIEPQSWAVIYTGLIFLITCLLMVTIYVLGDSSNPTPGLALYAMYVMVALLGWLAYILQQIADIPVPLDLSFLATIANSYILFLAAGRRAGITRGWPVLGLLALAAGLSSFFLSAEDMFVVQACAVTILFAATGIVSAQRAWRRSNIGDAFTAFATLLIVVAAPLSLYYWLLAPDQALARTLVFAAHSTAFVIIGLGFLTSVMIEYQQQLSHLATEDPLTRLPNRRGLENALEITLAQAARQRLPTSAIMVDIDRLEPINDSFGPDAGDQVIRRVARYLQRMSRASDVASRIEGDQFLLVLPQTGLDAAHALAERIRAAIAEQPLVIGNDRIPVTVSIGVATDSGAANLEQLAAATLRALALAKRGGLNRVASVESAPVRLSSAASPL